MPKLYILKKTVFFFILFFLLLVNKSSIAQPVIEFNSVNITGLSSPIDLVNAKDGTNRIFIAEQGGAIKVYTSGFAYIGVFVTVTGMAIGGEQGLLSVAFHPDYANSNPAIGGFFYVYYTNAAGDLELARYHVSSNPDIADAASKIVVMTIPHPTNTNHNGGKLNFGAENYLYFATGDGGSGGDPPNNAQRGDVLLGKMLRINVTNSSTLPYYTIPADNPYVGAGFPLDEIWAFGLRNPFRWSFDRANQNMWIGDVGQGAKEEINFRTAGTTGGINYGWRCYEGNNIGNPSGCGPSTNYVFPVYEYPNPGGAAVTGGVVYRGSTYPAMQGYYMAADVYSANLYLINSTTFSTTVQPGLPGSIVCFGEAENGEVYAVSLGGTVYNVATSSVLPLTMISFTALANSRNIELNWKTGFEQSLKQFEIEYSFDALQFYRAGIVIAKNETNGASYTYNHNYSLSGQLFYRLKIIDIDGSYSYSAVISVNAVADNENFIIPSVITNNTLQLFIKGEWKDFTLIGINGQKILSRNISGQTGRIDIPLKSLHPGIYMAILRNADNILSQKIIIQQ